MNFDTPYGVSKNDLTQEEYDTAKILDRYFGMTRPYGDKGAACRYNKWLSLDKGTQWLVRRLVVHYGWYFIVYKPEFDVVKPLWNELDFVPVLRFQTKNWQYTRLIEHGII